MPPALPDRKVLDETHHTPPTTQRYTERLRPCLESLGPEHDDHTGSCQVPGQKARDEITHDRGDVEYGSGMPEKGGRVGVNYGPDKAAEQSDCQWGGSFSFRCSCLTVTSCLACLHPGSPHALCSILECSHPDNSYPDIFHRGKLRFRTTDSYRECSQLKNRGQLPRKGDSRPYNS
ncbi:hypothetical protein BaRGS_00010520 [Batillaria attramentaria]|uniref:Uncharacterized protein n=1 Tax=Batillaria attramentaria TaxID=370345 RepID=A0ABD0LFQ2_9CAEN